MTDSKYQHDPTGHHAPEETVYEMVDEEEAVIAEPGTTVVTYGAPRNVESAPPPAPGAEPPAQGPKWDVIASALGTGAVTYSGMRFLLDGMWSDTPTVSLDLMDVLASIFLPVGLALAAYFVVQAVLIPAERRPNIVRSSVVFVLLVVALATVGIMDDSVSELVVMPTAVSVAVGLALLVGALFLLARGVVRNYARNR